MLHNGSILQKEYFVTTPRQSSHHVRYKPNGRTTCPYHPYTVLHLRNLLYLKNLIRPTTIIKMSVTTAHGWLQTNHKPGGIHVRTRQGAQGDQASIPSAFGCGRDGRRYLKGFPGWTGILGSVGMTARNGRAGTAGDLGCGVYQLPLGGQRDLQVIGGDYKYRLGVTSR